MTYLVVETECEQCGEVNTHLTSMCPVLELPVCRWCGEQHVRDGLACPIVRAKIAAMVDMLTIDDGVSGLREAS